MIYESTHLQIGLTSQWAGEGHFQTLYIIKNEAFYYSLSSSFFHCLASVHMLLYKKLNAHLDGSIIADALTTSHFIKSKVSFIHADALSLCTRCFCHWECAKMAVSQSSIISLLLCPFLSLCFLQTLVFFPVPCLCSLHYHTVNYLLLLYTTLLLS